MQQFFDGFVDGFMSQSRLFADCLFICVPAILLLIFRRLKRKPTAPTEDRPAQSGGDFRDGPPPTVFIAHRLTTSHLLKGRGHWPVVGPVFAWPAGPWPIP